MALKCDWRAIAPLVIYRAYPDRDLLPIAPPSGETIGVFALRAEAAGDTLFLFLCREANDDIDAEEYLHRLDSALGDIEQVRDALFDLVAETTPRQPSSPDSIP